MVRPKALALLGILSCSQPTDPNTAQAVSKPAAPQAEPKAPAPSFQWTTGLLSLMPKPFDRFDGSQLFRILWPSLDNSRFQLAPDDPRYAIGVLYRVLSPGGDGEHARLAAVLVSGERPDSTTRQVRLVMAETQVQPPGPLLRIAASSPRTLTVTSDAKFQLEVEGTDLVLRVEDKGQRGEHYFLRKGPFLMRRPPKEGLAQPKP